MAESGGQFGKVKFSKEDIFSHNFFTHIAMGEEEKAPSKLPQKNPQFNSPPALNHTDKDIVTPQFNINADGQQ